MLGPRRRPRQSCRDAGSGAGKQVHEETGLAGGAARATHCDGGLGSARGRSDGALPRMLICRGGRWRSSKQTPLGLMRRCWCWPAAGCPSPPPFAADRLSPPRRGPAPSPLLLTARSRQPARLTAKTGVVERTIHNRSDGATVARRTVCFLHSEPPSRARRVSALQGDRSPQSPPSRAWR
jgi:hypothetical protein